MPLIQSKASPSRSALCFAASLLLFQLMMPWQWVHAGIQDSSGEAHQPTCHDGMAMPNHDNPMTQSVSETDSVDHAKADDVSFDQACERHCALTPALTPMDLNKLTHLQNRMDFPSLPVHQYSIIPPVPTPPPIV